MEALWKKKPKTYIQVEREILFHLIDFLNILPLVC